ncbi:hypothetical protein [Streptomyces sp. YIM 98790]|uniref:hypothetical protein n=1 Tax=Streptomyces sp. YIM 98790 TaxID=2689077 RepID=UPI00140869EE|nr:hypothetical protein [Streptomyces sp. YIM 98790]
MSDLKVPFEMLENFGGEMQSIKNRMNGTGQDVENYEDDMGDDRVKKALEDFVDNWRDGRKEIEGQLEAIKEISDQVVDTFRTMDHDLESSLEGDGSEGGGGDQPV